ncbi:MAG: extracellular solute-binding protein [Clostridia bacterium]|nr:extracellular solute-binding protein [Clostridia bacterium]
MKKSISLLLVLTMLLGFASVAARGEAIEGVPDLRGKTVRLLSMETYASSGSFSDIMPLFKRYEEMTGVTIEWDSFSTDYVTVMQTRLAAGINLPDVVSLGGSLDLSLASKLIEDEMFVNINDYLDDLPNISRFFNESRPDIRRSLTYYDGGIYLLPCSTYNNREDEFRKLQNGGDNIIWYRKDIADKLGIGCPTTIDEMHALLLAYKDYDPDMIPMLVRDWTTWCSPYVFAGSYGLHFEQMDSSSDYFYPDENDRIVFEPITDAALEFVTEMNKWYSEGLFGFNADRQALAASGKAGAVWYQKDANRISTNKLLAENGFPEGHFAPVPWLYGPEAKRGIGMRAPFGGVVGITDTENAKTALEFLDFVFFSDFGIACQLAGVYGDNWYYDENGMPMLNDETLQAWYVDKTGNWRTVGGGVHIRMPQIKDYNIEYGLIQQLIDCGINEPFTEESLNAYLDWQDAAFETLPFMFYTQDEMEEYNSLYMDIKTYVQESLTRFIMGEEPLANWAAYKENVQKMGIEKVVAIVQSAYDRYLSN